MPEDAGDNAHCNVTCAGDSSQQCGGARHMSIALDPGVPDLAPDQLDQYNFMGCFNRSEVRSGQMPYHQTALEQTKMTRAACLQSCQTNGFNVAALQNGYDCQCGNMWTNELPPRDLDARCTVQCTGSDEDCGDVEKVTVFYADPKLLSVAQDKDVSTMPLLH